MNFQGGTGVLIGTPNIGLLPTHAAPTSFPVLQEVSVEFKGDLKELHGQYQYALDILRGKVKVTGKGKMIVPTPDVLSQIFFGLDTTEGVNRPVFNESHAPSSSVAPTHGTANASLGVINGDTGNAMRPITSGTPEVGEYKFTAAVAGTPGTPAAYVFATGETATSVLLSYTWPDSTNGVTLEITNQMIGMAPQMSMALFNTYKNKLYSLTLNAVVLGSFSIPTKQEDHWISDFDFQASADLANVLGYIEADL
jgi:hypothetical protein